ncbi:MAG: ferritin family protein [Rhodospirillaceae bacterium]|nr:ferritin family protein [Rhodospirillales bacterium]
MTSKVALFLAHSIALETEAGDRYEELADVMEVHNNPDIAELFRRMSEFSRKHADSVRERARAFQPLPKLKSWEYRWNAPEPPEVGDFSATHYLMTPYHALQFALGNERRGWEYYSGMAAGTSNAELRELAHTFAEEEADHLRQLEQWLTKVERPVKNWADDPDPAAVID